MGDILERLRGWCMDETAPSAQDLMTDAAKEIERLRGLVQSHEALLLRCNAALCSAMDMIAPAPPPDELDGYDMLSPYNDEDDE